MIDGKGLLDQLLGAAGGQAGSTEGAGGLGGGLGGELNNMLGGALGSGAGGGLGGGLGGMLGGLLGGGSGGGGAGGFGGILGQVTDYVRENPGISTAIAGGVGAVLMGGGRGAALRPNALTLGGLAGIGALAYKAYQQYQANNPASPPPVHAGTPIAPPPADSGFAPQNATAGENDFALALISAMINAAKADGHVDDDERQKVLGKLSEGGLTAEEQAFLDREMAAPLDIDKVVSAAQTPEEGVQLYAASLLTIAPDQPADRAYLDMLAARLGIDAGLKANIEQTVKSASTPA